MLWPAFAECLSCLWSNRKVALKRTPGPLQGDAWVQCCKTLHAVRKDFKPKNTFSLHSDKSMENHTLWSHTKLNNSTQSNTQSNWQQSETGDFTSSLTKPCWQQQHHNPKPCCVSHVHCTPVFQKRRDSLAFYALSWQTGNLYPGA